MFPIDSENGISSCPDYPPTIGLNSSALKPILDEIDTYLSSQVSSNNVPGLISTIVYDQSQIFVNGYGSRDIFNSSAPPPSGNDLVEVASITKVFTDLLLYYIRDNLPQYNLNLNDPVTKYIPTFSIKNEYNSNPITLINLATQTSGLQRESPCPFSTECNETQILELLSQRYLTLPGYTRFHYSNLGIALLGRSIEKLFCKSGCYENKLKQLILNGLNFSIYSGFNYSQEIIDNYMAVGVAGYENGKPIKAKVGSLGWENPCGGLLANANDLSKLMMFLFRNNITINDNKYQILNGSTIEEILKPKILLRNGYQSIGSPWEMEYFVFNTTRNTTIGVWYKGKEGELSGYRSAVVIVPQYKIGIFNSALISDVSASHVWTYDVLNMLIPYIDDILYKNGNNNKYILPNNYQLLIGSYRQKGYTFMVNISVVVNQQNVKLKYLKATDSGGDVLRLNIFENDKNVLRAHNLDGTQCRWLDDGQDQELVYFQFDNGENKHATSFIFMETQFVYVNDGIDY